MYLVFNIGATKTKIGVSDNLSHINKKKIFETDSNFNKFLFSFEKEIDSFGVGKNFKKVVGGIAGVFDESRQKLIKSPNLPNWENLPIKVLLDEVVEAPVTLENDTDLEALGESSFGSGGNEDIVAYLSFGTGVGGSRIVKGRIDANRYGFEPGHQIVNAKNFLDLEYFASGSGIRKKFKKDASEIIKKSTIERVNKYALIGVYNTILFWSPDVVVLGGGLVENNLINISEIRSGLHKKLTIFESVPKVVKAKLEDYSGLYGALEYIRLY